MRAYLIGMLACLLLTGCITIPPSTSVTPLATPTTATQSVTAKGSKERLVQAAEISDNYLEICTHRAKQQQIASAIGYVRCWGEPTRQAYQQSDLLIMDLVEKWLDTMYRAAAMFDSDQLTTDQFVTVHKQAQDWFIEEVRKRLVGQLSATPPAPSSPAVTTHYK